MKKKIIVGNWKMNPESLEEATRVFTSVRKVASRLSSAHIVICPPDIYIQKFTSSRSRVSTSISIGAQNASIEEHGAFTGETSPIMLKDIGVTHIILGHSERRSMGETDEIVAKKVKTVLEVGIHPILCVGESTRDEQVLYLDTLKNQIKNSLAGVAKRYITQILIAYEPVWAVGAKEPMNPLVIEEMVIFIKKVLSDMFGHDEALQTAILYGGAVNFRNAPDIITKGKVDGLLVGRESVNVPSFIELIKSVDKL